MAAWVDCSIWYLSNDEGHYNNAKQNNTCGMTVLAWTNTALWRERWKHENVFIFSLTLPALFTCHNATLYVGRWPSFHHEWNHSWECNFILETLTCGLIDRHAIVSLLFLKHEVRVTPSEYKTAWKRQRRARHKPACNIWHEKTVCTSCR